MNFSQYYVSSTMFWGLPPEEWFRTASACGLGGLEVWAQQLESERVGTDRLRGLSRQYGLTLTVHSYSWDMNLISLSRPMRRAAERLTKEAIDLARALHAEQITIHPGRDGLAVPGVDFDAELARSAVLLSGYGRQAGVTISFEIMEKLPKERLTSAEAALRMEALAGSTDWGYTVDTAHCDSEDEIFHHAETLRGRVLEFHVSNKRGTERHIADVEAGDLNLPSVTARLAAYGLPLILEGFDPSGRAERLLRTLRWLGMDVVQTERTHVS